MADHTVELQPLCDPALVTYMPLLPDSKVTEQQLSIKH